MVSDENQELWKQIIFAIWDTHTLMKKKYSFWVFGQRPAIYTLYFIS